MKITDLSPRLLAYLQSWHETSTRKKIEAGYEVDLPFSDFLNLFTKRQLDSLQKAIDADRIRYQQDVENKFAFVLTWKSYAACSTGRFDKETATVCSRAKSAQINLPKQGDKLRPKHRAKIAAGLMGKEKTQEHRDNIGDGGRGVPKQAWTEERKDARRQLLAKKKAEKLAAQRAAQDAALAALEAQSKD